jgi:hypothetical protein
MSNLYRGPSIDASYQISVHLAMQFRRRFLKIGQSETRIAENHRPVAKHWQTLSHNVVNTSCQRQCELLPLLGVRRPLTFHILIFSSETYNVFQCFATGRWFSSLPPVVSRRAHVLFTLFVFACT